MFVSGFYPPSEGDFPWFTTATMIEWAPLALVVLAFAGTLVTVWWRRRRKAGAES